ncbi:hypothetical protein ACU4I5_20275 [Ensifer adhaerens]
MDNTQVTATSELPYATGDFDRFFWLTFSAKKASRAILDPRPSFHGYKDVLLAALLAWTISPIDFALRKKITIAAIMHKVISAEKWAAKRAANPNYADFNARHVRLGPQFISELYYCVGGLKAAYNAPSAKEISLELIKQKKSAYHANEVMRIYHFVFDERPSLVKGSLDRAIHVIHKIWKQHYGRYKAIGFTPYDGRQIKQFWGDHADLIAYLYAASHTAITGQRTLLDDLLAGNLKANANAPWVSEWLGRAAYAATLLSDNYDKGAFEDNRAKVPECAPERIGETGLTTLEEDLIRTVFSPNFDLKNDRMKVCA